MSDDANKKPAKPIYLVVHTILENGVEYKPGDVYKGKNAAYFLNGGQIKTKE